MKGAAEILHLTDSSAYTHIVSAVGTGTTLAGLISAAPLPQKVIGISALKNNYSLQSEIEILLPADKHDSFQLLHEYHFGGYAKHTKELLQFMNELYLRTKIPTDFISNNGGHFHCIYNRLPGRGKKVFAIFFHNKKAVKHMIIDSLAISEAVHPGIGVGHAYECPVVF